MAGLRAAEAFAKANQPDAALAALESVMKNSTEPGFKPIAGVRLAGLLLDQKKYDEATKAIDSGNIGPVSGEMAASVADRRGDILAAQGKASDAKAAWEEALKPKAYDLYNYLLALIVAIMREERHRVDIATQQAQREGTEVPSPKFAYNKFATQLEENKQLNDFMETLKQRWEDDIETVRKLCNQIEQSEIYREYMNS